jgi:hypothetical protein
MVLRSQGSESKKPESNVDQDKTRGFKLNRRPSCVDIYFLQLLEKKEIQKAHNYLAPLG